MGYKNDESLIKSYPVVKLADFGLAELTGPDDARNPIGLYGLGSKAYKPPVSSKVLKLKFSSEIDRVLYRSIDLAGQSLMQRQAR